MLSISTMDPCFPAHIAMFNLIANLSSCIGACMGCQTEELWTEQFTSELLAVKASAWKVGCCNGKAVAMQTLDFPSNETHCELKGCSSYCTMK